MRSTIAMLLVLNVLMYAQGLNAQTYPAISEADRIERLKPPSGGPVRMVLDTDTYNEIDDQFAVVYALISPELDAQAVYAAPFQNSRSSGPGDGMEKSYEEILKNHFGTKVDIDVRGDKGTIQIHFFDKEDFSRVYSMLLQSKTPSE